MTSESCYRVLAIDDVPANVLTIRAILSPDEFLLFEASDSHEAFRFLQSNAVDLILLDVVLPGMDGYEIARRLKQNPATASVPVIFLTSLKTEDEIVKGFEVGGVDFISKPFRKAELLLRLRTHLALKDKNEALEKAAAELREANDARDKFFSILAHDLKNPFAGFLSLLEAVASRTGLDPEDLQESLATMQQTARNVYRLLETLLDWGRSQTGAMPITVETQIVSFLVEEAIDPLETALRDKNIRLELAPLSFRVEADRYTTVAVLRNLLSNAVKFSNPGSTVSVSAREDGSQVWISVSDRGVGIPPHRLPLLFRMDSKMSTPGTRKEPGTGLGLILCAEFSSRNNGELSVESKVGEGSTFTLRLRRALP